jgi:hypothetical protein
MHREEFKLKDTRISCFVTTPKFTNPNSQFSSETSSAILTFTIGEFGSVIYT